MLTAYLGFASLAGAAVCLVLLLSSLLRKRRKAPAAIGLAACLLLCAVCMALTPAPAQGPDRTCTGFPETATPAPVPTLTATPAATAAPAPPTPTPAPDYDGQLTDYQAQVEQAALDALDGLFDEGASRSVTFTPATGTLLLEVQGTDNLSPALIRKGMLADIRDTLAALPLQDLVPPEAPADAAPALGLEQVLFSVRFPMQDGQEPPIVLKAAYARADLDAVDWSHTGAIDWETLATDFWAAPALEEG